VINWMLEVEDVEDVACTVDDMESTVVHNLWFRGDGVREGETRVGYKEWAVLSAGSARL
jgi:hypothetical protein